jgi:hypothetical protein
VIRPTLIRYDPDWLADGRLDQRRYPVSLIVAFWIAVTACIAAVVGLGVSVLVADRTLAAALFLVLAVGLGSLGLVRERAKTASVR